MRKKVFHTWSNGFLVKFANMMSKKSVGFIFFVFFSCFVYINADLISPENHNNETSKYQQNINADNFEDDGIPPPLKANGGVQDICNSKNPCQHEGTCQPDSEKGFKCSCVNGVTGKNCETVEWCKDNKALCGNATCLYDKNLKSGICFCEKGLYFDTKNKSCKDLDKCLLRRIKGECSGHHELCGKNGECTCEENYAYNENTCEPDFCWIKSPKSRCGPNMDCIEGDKSFFCSCKDGFWQVDEKCEKIDECTPGVTKCQHKCVKGECSCFKGYKLNKNKYTCDVTEQVSECSLDCGKGTCLNDGTEDKCNCPEISHSFINGTCIDKCKAGLIKEKECPNGCFSDENFGYRCNCTGKYNFADDGIHCKATLLCSEGGGNIDCELKGGFCKDDFAVPKGYTCECKFGFKEDKKTGKCKHKCETADCDRKQALCSISVNNEVECVCPPLMVKGEDGTCNQLAKYSFLGDFSVPKSIYRVITQENSDTSKRNTAKDINYGKLLKHFEDAMRKIFKDYKGASIVNCTDEVNDWNCFMEIKLDKDPGQEINIISTPSVCLPLLDESHCLIQPEFVKKKRTSKDAKVFKKTQRCDEGIIAKLCGIETKCEESDNGFKCQCKPGYFRRTSFVPAQDILVDVCEDINECLDSTICPNTTICTNLPGDYTCNCRDGFLLEPGKTSKKDGCRDVCDPNPCVHGKCLQAGKDGFICSCEGVYTGQFCNQTKEDITGIKKETNKTTAIVGGVVGAFLLVTIIIVLIIFLRLKKQKSCDDTEENVRQRTRGLSSEMKKIDEQQPDIDNFELRDSQGKHKHSFENPMYSATNPVEGISNPRLHTTQSTSKAANDDISDQLENGDNRKGYIGDDKVFAESHSSRHSGKDRRQLRGKDEDREGLL